MKRVGIIFSFDMNWVGGVNYFKNLISAVYELPDSKIEIVIFTGLKTSINYFEGFPVISIIRNSIFDRGTFSWILRKFWMKIFSYDLFLERLLKKYDVDVLSHSGWIGKNSKIPTIGWIVDFQHIHLPELFSRQEIKLRNTVFKDLCRYCTTVIVSSYDALSDLKKFSPACEIKSQVLQFAVSISDQNVILPSRREIELKYKFSGNFIHLPNQFWRHKNHKVVIEALGQLRLEGKNVLILASGNTEDYLRPKYFSELMTQAKAFGVVENFIPLGLVPIIDLTALMIYSTAMINPSFFEGWSTSVEEAKSLGKLIILSDISVHREQNPSHAIYFKPEDSSELAAILWEVWTKPDVMEDVENVRIETSKRRYEFAKKYQQIVLHVESKE